MGKYVYGTGSEDLFEIEYDDFGTPTTGEGAYISDSAFDFRFTAFQNEALNSYFEKTEEYASTQATDTDMPLKLSGDPGVWRYSDSGNASQYFSFATLFYSGPTETDLHIVSSVTDVQRLLWHPVVQEDYIGEFPVWIIDSTAGGTVSIQSVEDLETDLTYVSIRPMFLDPDKISGLTRAFERYAFNNVWGNATERNNGGLYAGGGQASMYLPRLNIGSPFPRENDVVRDYISVDGNFLGRVETSALNYARGGARFYIASEHMCKMFLAYHGLRFEFNGVRYKPIVEGGYVVGYTDDDNVTSEWDDWENITDHDVPSDRPPVRDKDEYADIGLTLNANGQSFLKWYAVTASGLEQLLSWCNSEEVPAGFEPLDYIVGVMQAPCSIPAIAATSGADIYLGPENTGVPAHLLGNQGNYSVMHLGGKTISPLYNSYLDYEPYTKIDVYIPYCGSVSLPPSVFVGATINIDFLYDIFTGECAGVIYRNNTYYTSLGGNFTTMQAVTAQNVGAIKEAVINGCMSVIGGGAAAAAGIATGNIVAAAGGLAAMTTGTIKSLETLNGISPTMRGNSGGRVNFYKPSYPILYMTRPDIDPPQNYGHTVGYPCNKTRKVGGCHGLIVCTDVDTSGINATNKEKEIIKQLMETGVYI